ncbi:MAG: hypothetical protein IT434_04195 [Phycisphaerales bacterium]|nr:hypothetical protein [Phycisphaerales bacterium]
MPSAWVRAMTLDDRPPELTGPRVRSPRIRTRVLVSSLVGILVITTWASLSGRLQWSTHEPRAEWFRPLQMPSSSDALYDRAGMWNFLVMTASEDGQVLGNWYAWGVSVSGSDSLVYLCDSDGSADLESAWLGRKDSGKRADHTRLVALVEDRSAEIRVVGDWCMRRCVVLSNDDPRVTFAMRRTYLLPGGK